MKVLITGGTGFIGGYVVNAIKESHEIRIFTEGNEKSTNDGIEYFRGDIRKLDDLEKAANGYDAIIHLAGGHADVPHTPDAMEKNALGTFNVMEAAARNGVRKIVHASSDSTLGFIFREREFSLDYFPVDEKHSLNPQDAYGLSKALGEEICRCYTNRCGIQTISLRFCWVWSPDYYGRHSEIATETAYSSSDPSNDSLNARRLWGYVDVRDVAQACRLALEVENLEHEVFFITATDTFSTEPTLELIRKYYPKVKSISTDYLSDEYKSLYNISKAERLLGYKPKYSWRNCISLPNAEIAQK